MSEETGWSEQASQGFIDNGAFFVPARQTQMETICAMLPQRTLKVVELCCGEGLLAREILATHPAAHILALDGSDAMLRATETALAGFHGRFATQRFDVHAADWRRFDEPVDAFVSSLAIHHLDAGEKAALFRDLHAALAPGGIAVIADVMSPATPPAKHLAGQEWNNAVREQSRRLRGDESAFAAFVDLQWNMYTNPMHAIDKPSTLFEQLQWLKDAGFADVDVYWMRAGHAIFGGTKPAA